MDCAGRYLPRYDFTSAVQDELQLEIGIRRRLKQVVEARLKWARALKDALENEVKGEEVDTSITDHCQSFPAVAKEVHAAIERGCEFFFARQSIDDTLLPKDILQQTLPPPPESTGRLRNPPMNRVRGDKDGRKELYIRDPSSTPPLVYKIACADCGRADFPGVQGLLNHARIKHTVEYSNHDECIQRCAVVVPDDEVEALVRNGIEISGMHASLRRLFEMALGANVGLMGEESYMARQAAGTGMVEKNEASGSTILTRTLGHHVDTPALAPFLGRAPTRRQVNVYDEEVDTIGEDAMDVTPVRGFWKMKFQKRSQPVGDAVLEDAEDDTLQDQDTPQVSTALNPHNQTGSRFHITARVVVSDRSLHLSESLIKKLGSSLSHRWQLSVHSPSYSLHSSTVISKMTVRCLTVPVPPGFTEPIIITEPPFFATGLTGRPFLASVTLEWAGSSNKPTEVEHYVDLDVTRSTRPVLGEEQYVDVELDRHTVFLPRREDTWEMDWHSDSDEKRVTDRGAMSKRVEAKSEHSIRLKALLPRFPLTRKANSLRTVPRVPYFLPQSVAHYHELVPGRQKATQWGRARAIWEAYCEGPSPANTSEEDRAISSPLDVYRWMEEEGHLPKPQIVAIANPKIPSVKGKEKAVQEVPELYCSVCGYLCSLHPQMTLEDGRVLPYRCVLPDWMRKPPLLDTYGLRILNPILKVPPRPSKARLKATNSPVKLSNRELTLAEDPKLTLAVNLVASTCQLSCLETVSTRPEGLHDASSLYEALAPSAVLAIATRALVRRLVDAGVQVIGQQRPPAIVAQSGTSSSGVSRKEKVSRQVPALAKKRLLTSAHIMQGVCSQGASALGTSSTSSRNDSMIALLVAIGRLGTTEGLENLIQSKVAMVSAAVPVTSS